MSQIGGHSQDARGAGQVEGALVEAVESEVVESGRVVALDLGARRIGVAYSDSRRTLASPWGMVERSGDLARDHAAVVAVLDEVEARTVVVGLPLSLSGGRGPAAQAALAEVATLRQVSRAPGYHRRDGR